MRCGDFRKPQAVHSFDSIAVDRAVGYRDVGATAEIKSPTAGASRRGAWLYLSRGDEPKVLGDLSEGEKVELGPMISHRPVPSTTSV